MLFTEGTSLSVNTDPSKILGEASNSHNEGVIIISLIGKSKEENIIGDSDFMFNLLADSEFGNEMSSNPRYDKTKHEVVLNIKDSSRIPNLLRITELKDNNNLGIWPIECTSPVCSGCNLSEYKVVEMCYHNDEGALKLFRQHGVLPMSMTCPKCNKACTLNETKNKWFWRCQRQHSKGKQKKKRCNFSMSDNRGSFLENSHLKSWKVLMFINIWLRKHFSQASTIDNLDINSATSVAWGSSCSEITQFWFNNQKPIGGENIVVEIDEILVVEKMERGKCGKKIRLFGGIEHESKKCFVVPFVQENDTSVQLQKHNSSTLISLIKKYIVQNSILYSDKWKAYSLNKEGYIHKIVQPKDSSVHTQCIQRLLRNTKEWVRGPGVRKKYIKEYVCRYLFLRQCKKGEELHNFLIETANLYNSHIKSKSQSKKKALPIPRYKNSDLEKDSDLENSDSQYDLDSEEDLDSEQDPDLVEDYLEKVFGSHCSHC
ncbi:unnamed protein product [Meganyctiphanes norvegica]|uniref:ISXO2-like transposase domain-containing protein n=1 Tax=Meganyctiphanes norvegica TaxID=48144 RepID=A0AAV2RBS1_MEGNR